jgi:N-acetylglutamate synthase-like GNAT family acetyltransferase
MAINLTPSNILAGADACYLERLTILPECRIKGYGKTLVNHIFVIATEIGIQRVEI